jgi:hypothetical protein
VLRNQVGIDRLFIAPQVMYENVAFQRTVE